MTTKLISIIIYSLSNYNFRGIIMKNNKSTKKEKTRIYDWFAGESNGSPVIFKFTYSWDLDKQVIVESDTYSKNMEYRIFQLAPALTRGHYQIQSFALAATIPHPGQ